MNSAKGENGSLAQAFGLLLMGTAFITVAVPSLIGAFGALENLWADHQDSPAGTYILFGGILLAVALVSGALGIRFFNRGYHRIR